MAAGARLAVAAWGAEAGVGGEGPILEPVPAVCFVLFHLLAVKPPGK